MHFTRHSRSKHPDGSFRLGRVMVPPDRCCSVCSVAVRRSFNPTKRRSSVCSAAVRLFLALVQRQRIGPRSCRREVWCSKRALPFSRFSGFSDSVRLSGVFESQRQGLTPYRPWDIGEMIDSIRWAESGFSLFGVLGVLAACLASALAMRCESQ